jgi:hypothetical protein
LNAETSGTECHVPHPTTAPSYIKPAAPKTSLSKPAVLPSFPVEISISPVRVENCSLNLIGNKEEKEGDDFIPMTLDKPSGLDLEDFLPVSIKCISFPFNYVQFCAVFKNSVHM